MFDWGASRLFEAARRATDAIVRVEAGRLRAALSRYYVDEGANDQIVISLPRGRYVPSFATRHAPVDNGVAAAGDHAAYVALMSASRQCQSLREQRLVTVTEFRRIQASVAANVETLRSNIQALRTKLDTLITED